MSRWLLVAVLPAILLFACATPTRGDNAGDIDVVNQILEQKDAEIAGLRGDLDQALNALAAAESTATPEPSPAQAKEIARLEGFLADLTGQIAVLGEDVASGQERAEQLSLEVRRLETELADSLAREAEATVLLEAALDELSVAEAVQSEDLAANGGASTMSASQTLGTDPPMASARLSEALRGGGGFKRVDSFLFAPSTRSRLPTATELAIDESGVFSIMYDTRLDYETTAVFLSIQTPNRGDPSLYLTGQYVTDVEPIYAQTAVVAIEGLDPIDPIDPIVLSGPAIRETDGVMLRESFVRTIDRLLVDQISAMLSSNRVTVTFVGSAGQFIHRPTVPERQAMANVLFAYIDMGGLQ